MLTKIFREKFLKVIKNAAFCLLNYKDPKNSESLGREKSGAQGSQIGGQTTFTKGKQDQAQGSMGEQSKFYAKLGIYLGRWSQLLGLMLSRLKKILYFFFDLLKSFFLQFPTFAIISLLANFTMVELGWRVQEITQIVDSFFNSTAMTSLREDNIRLDRLFASQKDTLNNYSELIAELEVKILEQWRILEIIKDYTFSIIETCGGNYYGILGNSSYLMSVILAILWLMFIFHLGKNDENMKKYYRALGIFPLLFNISLVYIHGRTQAYIEQSKEFCDELSRNYVECLEGNLKGIESNYKLGNKIIEEYGHMVEIYMRYMYENNQELMGYGFLPSMTEKPAFCFLSILFVILVFILCRQITVMLIIDNLLRKKNIGIIKLIRDSYKSLASIRCNVVSEHSMLLLQSSEKDLRQKEGKTKV